MFNLGPSKTLLALFTASVLLSLASVMFKDKPSGLHINKEACEYVEQTQCVQRWVRDEG